PPDCRAGHAPAERRGGPGAGRARPAARRHPLLHGGGLARSARRAGVRPRPRHGPGGPRTGHGSVRHARHPHPPTGPPAARHPAAAPATPLVRVAEVRERAAHARRLGATRFCMGAAWRGPRDGPAFDRVLDMVRAVRELGMEACVTLGMLTDEQARRLRDAGLTAYNHNLDTSRRHYGAIITTRT